MIYDHIDLFSGIGGFALAARWAGIQTVQFVEIDPFCQKVLRKNFPGVPIHDDIKTFKYAKNNTAIDVISSPFILTGGFPCQPFSCAGKRRGKEDDRYLWPEMLRIIQEAKPCWILGENVTGIISMGLDDCISDLENQGYEVQTLIIPACAVNAPHRRDRVWIVAKSTSGGWGSWGTECTGQIGASTLDKTDRHAPDTDNSTTSRQRKHSRDLLRITKPERFDICDRKSGTQFCKRKRQAGSNNQRNGRLDNTWSEPWLEVATRLCRVDDGVPRKLDRVNRLKALGNAIVPQVAYEIMKGILKIKKEG